MNNHLVQDPAKVRSGRWAPRLIRIRFVAPVMFVVTIVGAWTVFVVLARLSGFHVTWWAPRLGSVPSDKRADLVRDTLGVLALFGAVFASIYAYRKQRLEESAGHRADAEGLSKRYQDVAEQLGHEKAAVRLAGAYAMARLADEWPEQRQTCVDVLCAYLRMPWIWRDDPPHDRDDAEAEVRSSILQLIASHVDTRSTGASWTDLNFNLTRAVLPQVRFMRCHFRQRPNFTECEFLDRFLLAGTLSRGADFIDADFRGIVIIGQLVIEAANINFSDATFRRMTRIEVKDIKPDAALRLSSVKCLGDVTIRLRRATTPQGRVTFDGAYVFQGGAFTVEESPRADLGPHLQVVDEESWVDDETLDSVHLPENFIATETLGEPDDRVVNRWHREDWTPPVI